MNTIIYYFTGTGNSLAVARHLAAKLHGSIKLLPVAKLINQHQIEPDCDTVGIVFPVNLHDLPDIIERFVKKLVLKGQYVFGICTYNSEPSNTLFRLQDILYNRGNTLHSGFGISMPGNSVIMMDLTTTDKENAIRFAEEEVKIAAIAQIVNKKQLSGIEGPYYEDETYELKNFVNNVYHIPDNFRVNGSCSVCGLCAKICPIGNITMSGEKAVWGQNCTYCLACLHWCPAKAIQNGEISESCRRYHHPDISLEDMLLSN